MKTKTKDINAVELCGTVGTVRQRFSSDVPMTALTLATNEMPGDANFITTTWHRVNIYPGVAGCPADGPFPGDRIHLKGKLKARIYTDADGLDRVVTEVEAEQILSINGKPCL